MTAEEEPSNARDDGEKQTKAGKKAPPANLVIPPKKPKLTKAERRALQEAQRAAKAAGGGKPQKQPQKQQQQKQQSQPQGIKKDGEQSTQSQQQTDKNASANTQARKETTDDKTVDLFSHLPQYRGTWLIFFLALTTKSMGEYIMLAHFLHLPFSNLFSHNMTC